MSQGDMSLAGQDTAHGVEVGEAGREQEREIQFA